MKKISILTILILLLFTACQQAPVMQKDELYPCFKARDCHYRNPKNPEKCSDDDKECRSRERYVYCKDPLNRWKDCREQECWDKLNSK
jgi:hypothetical protein